MASPDLTNDLYFLILQYLNDNRCHEAAQKVEQESKVYFNTTRFKNLILIGKWDEAEEYLRSFTVPEDNLNSMTIFWNMGREKFLEALDTSNHEKAVDIFTKDLKVLWKDLPYKADQLTQLFTLKNFREHPEYSSYGDTWTMRVQLVKELGNLIRTNPKLYDKLIFPQIESLRLKHLIVQSLKHQHSLCGDIGIRRPVISTLFADHRCEQPSEPLARLQLQQRTDHVANEPVNEAGPSTSRTLQEK